MNKIRHYWKILKLLLKAGRWEISYLESIVLWEEEAKLADKCDREYKEFLERHGQAAINYEEWKTQRCNYLNSRAAK